MEETVMLAPLKKPDPTSASDYVQTNLVSDLSDLHATLTDPHLVNHSCLDALGAARRAACVLGWE